MSAPRNNLADVLKRKASNALANTPSQSPSISDSTKKQKFKPAAFVSTAVTPCQGSKSARLLPAFSTSGFKQIQQNQRTNDAKDIESINVSHTSGPATPNPLKRSSSDPDVVSDPSPQLSKRPKKTGETSNKENRPPTAVLDLDTFGFSRSPLTNDVGNSRHNSQWQSSNSDLLELSSGQLEQLRTQDLDLLQVILDRMRDHTTGDQVLLQRFQKQLSDRLEAIDLARTRKLQSSANTSTSTVYSNFSAGPSVVNSPKFSSVLTDKSANIFGAQPTTYAKDTLVKTIGVTAEPMTDPLMRRPAPDSDDEYWDSVGELSDHVLQTLNGVPSRLIYPQECRSPYYKEIRQQLSNVFRLKEFRPNQLEAITATMEGRDVFVLMPTGGGKSLCYQLPAVCKTGITKGVTIVVSPLTALMEDQVSALQKKGVDAIFWNAESQQQEVKARLWSGTKPSLLYVTPEKLRGSPACKSLLDDLYRKQQLARFAIDEAHCISTWGQDFRSAYKELGRLRTEYPNVPIIALTATANLRTREDIVNQLQLRNHACFTQSFNRPNLKYIVKSKKNIIDDIVDFIRKEHANHSGIVYCLARKTCESVAGKLREKELAARFYHAGLSKGEKNHLLDEWQNNKFRIIVATVAFGMGIDKADVRFVIHHDLPNSLSNYYQETGRAGRDGKPADCILYYQWKSFMSICRMIENDKDREEPLTPEAIQRQKDAAREVVKYCSNISECRRVQVLRYFGQEFNQQDCKHGCDNCQNEQELVVENVTPIARSTITVLRALSDNDEKITQSQLISILRGANTLEVQRRGFGKLKGYGDAKGFLKELLELTLDNMLVRDILTSTLQVNGWGYNNEYLELGPGVSTFESSGERLEVKWRPPTKGGSKPIKQPRRRKSGPDNNISNNQDPIEDFSDDDFNTRNGDDTGSPSDLKDPDEDVRSMKELYEKLDALRDLIKTKQHLPRRTDVVSEDVLQVLSYTCPQDYQEFRDITDHASPDLYPHFHNSRDQFLQICIQHKFGTTKSTPFSNSQLHSRFEYRKQ